VIKEDDVIKRILMYCGIFFAGCVFVANMSHLVEINQNYQAGWGKVAASIVIALFLSVMLEIRDD